MTEIAPQDWLEHHSGRIAQDCAVRLSLACSAVLPSDKHLAVLVEEQVLADLLELAFHGRRTMERRGLKDATVSSDPLWPVASFGGNSASLFDALGTIIHAQSLDVIWEKVDMQQPPYSGRDARFVAGVTAKSDNKTHNLPIGAIVASFFGSVLNRMEQVA